MLEEIILANCKTPEAVKRIVLGKPRKATLTPDHFGHIKEEYVWLRNLLNSALAKKQHRVNVLIYGKPGTGKTELAKTLCKEIGASLYGVSGNIFSECDGIKRRGELAAALRMLQDDKNSVLMMDEAEDVFGASRIVSISVPYLQKAQFWYNGTRLLEKARIRLSMWYAFKKVNQIGDKIMSRNFPFVLSCACFMVACVALYCFIEMAKADIDCTGQSTSCATYNNYWDGVCCTSLGYNAFTLDPEARKTRIALTGSCGTYWTWSDWGVACWKEAGGCGGTRVGSVCIEVD